MIHRYDKPSPIHFSLSHHVKTPMLHTIKSDDAVFPCSRQRQTKKGKSFLIFADMSDDTEGNYGTADEHDINLTSSSLPPLIVEEVKCRKNIVDLRYVVKNVDNMHQQQQSEVMAYPPKVTISGTDIRAKEVILVFMALSLLVCSVCLFFKHWKKNYRDINQASVYTFLSV